MAAQQQRPERWSCANGEALDLKRWFQGVITPDFASEEARERCASLDHEDPSAIHPLWEATRTMRSTTEQFNMGYVSMDGQRGLCSRWFSPLEPDSIRSCSSSLATTALGAGALAMPYAFSLTGIGLGLLTLTLAGLVSALSLQILMVAARYTNTGSYAAVLELAAGSRWASIALDVVLLLNGVGAAIAILIFQGDFLPAVVAAPPGAIGLQGFTLSRSAAVLGAALAVWPLTLMSNISGLRYVAMAVPVVMLITIGIVLADTPSYALAAKSAGSHIVWWDFEFGRWLQAVAIMVNAFANHQNAIPCVNQLSKPSIARIVKATVNGNMLVWNLLAALGVGGYASFAAATKGDFLLNYPDGRVEIWCCRVMLTVIVYLVLPVALFPTTKSCAQLVKSATGGTGEVSPVLHASCATFILGVCTTIALKVTNVSSVIGVCGGIFASSLMYWFPAAVYRLLLWPTQPRIVRDGALMALVLLGTLSWLSVAMKTL